MNPISKTINGMAYRHNARDIFRDFVEMSAISISNSVDRPQYDEREKRYMSIVKKYDKDEANEIAHMFAMTVIEMENNPRDVLGETYTELEMGNDRTGQFFTPYHISQMMAKVMFGDELKQHVDKHTFITLSEPACGAGGMVIAAATELMHRGINYQKEMHVTAVDIDPICVHMSYLQFSLLHIPATVIHGDTLKLEEWSRWYTPAHIIDGWDWKLRTRNNIQKVMEIMAEGVPELVAPIQVPEPKPVEAPKQKVAATQLSLF